MFPACIPLILKELWRKSAGISSLIYTIKQNGRVKKSVLFGSTLNNFSIHINYYYLFNPWIYFLWVSSFITWARFLEKIFSRPVRAWIPTIVTPIGQGAFPIAISKYLPRKTSWNYNSKILNESRYLKNKAFVVLRHEVVCQLTSSYASFARM